MALSGFQAELDGFEHAGLRVQLVPQPDDEEGRMGVCKIVDVESGEAVGSLRRHVYEHDGLLAARHDGQYLRPEYHGRGFSRALRAHDDATYPGLGIRVVTNHPRDAGGAVWAKFGYQFDLTNVEGPDEARRLARAVANIFSPSAPRRTTPRRFPPWRKREPNPHYVLRAYKKRGGTAALAVAEMRARIPTEEQIASGELEGTFTLPLEILEFEAHGIPLGEEVMLRAHWDGIRFVPPP